MGFYGNITNASTTQFTFDRVFPNRKSMDSTKSTDGVFVGRYVLIEYDNEYTEGVNDSQRVYRATTTYKLTTDTQYKSGKDYYTKSGETYTKQTSVVSGADISGDIYEKDLKPVDDDGNLILYSDYSCSNAILFASMPTGTLVYVDEADPRGTGEGGPYTYYICTGQNTDTSPKAVFELAYGSISIPADTSVQASINYVKNYNTDIEYYGTGRGYDSTVWQKTYVNGVEKYVMIAELNSVVPTFDITADAPTETPIPPHFDENSTNLYYKLHSQANWGLRVKAASKDLTGPILTTRGNIGEGSLEKLTTDTSMYPSDTEVTWVRHDFDSNNNIENTYYYDPEKTAKTEKWVEKTDDLTDIPTVPAAIYWNKAGFDSETIRYSTDTGLDTDGETTLVNPPEGDMIKLEPTGRSGHTYEDHNGVNTLGTQSIQNDTMELSIMLPSIGDSIASMWDIVYGGRDTDSAIAATNKRNLNVQWEDGAYPVREGLRMITDSYVATTPASAEDFNNSVWYVKNASTGKYELSTTYDSTGATQYYKANSGYTFDTTKVNTLAGCINSVHDLMGMIIVEKDATIDPDADDFDADDYDEQKIYYFKKDNTYRYKTPKYEYEEIAYKFIPVTSANGGVTITANNYTPNTYYTLAEGWTVELANNITTLLTSIDWDSADLAFTTAQIGTIETMPNWTTPEDFSTLTFEEQYDLVAAAYYDGFTKDKNDTFDSAKTYYAKLSNSNTNEEYKLVSVTDYMAGYYYKTVEGNYLYDNGDSPQDNVDYYKLKTLPTATPVTKTYAANTYYRKYTDTTDEHSADDYYIDTATSPAQADYYEVKDVEDAVVTVSNTINTSEGWTEYDETTGKYHVSDDTDNSKAWKELTYLYTPSVFYYYPTVGEAELLTSSNGTSTAHISGDLISAADIADTSDEKKYYKLRKETRPNAPFDDVQYYVQDRYIQTNTDTEGVTTTQEIRLAIYKVNVLPISVDWYTNRITELTTEIATLTADDAAGNATKINTLTELKTTYETTKANFKPYYYENGVTVGEKVERYNKVTATWLATEYTNLGLREYELDDDGNKIPDADIGYKYKDVRTTSGQHRIITGTFEKLTNKFYIPDTYYYIVGSNFIIDTATTLTADREYYDISSTVFEQITDALYKPNKYYYYDSVLNKYILSKSSAIEYTYSLANPAPTEETFDPLSHYIYDSTTQTYLLATEFSDSDTYYLKEAKKYYVKINFYVLSDEANVYAVHSIWNRSIDIIPCTVRLSKLVGDMAGTKMAKLTDFARSFNTIHGLILRLNNLLLDGDYDTRDRATVQGCINSLNDIINSFGTIDAHSFVISDDYGRIATAPWTTAQAFSTTNEQTAITETNSKVAAEDRWIEVDIDSNPVEPKVRINHTFTSVDNTTTVANKNTPVIDATGYDALGNNNTSDDTLKLYTPIVDAKGHIVGKNTETVTLPFGFQILKSENSSETGEWTQPEEANSDIIAANIKDAVTLAAGNKWIKTAVDTEEDNKLIIAHETHTVTESTSTADLSSADTGSTTFEIPSYTFDAAGHVSGKEVKTVTMPNTYGKFTGDEGSTEADCTHDTLAVTGDDWIKTTVSNDSVAFSHKAAVTETHTAKENVTPKFGETVIVTDLFFDTNGHKNEELTHTVTIPQGSYTPSNGSNSAAVITELGFTADTGALTSKTQNLISLKLTDYVAPTTSAKNDIAATDSLGEALSKLDAHLDQTDTDLSNAISALKYTDSNTTSNVVTLVNETNGVIAPTHANVGTLILTGYTTNYDNDGTLVNYTGKVVNTDSINSAFAKVSNDIFTLVGTDTGKSVRTIANEELVAQLVATNAKESLDTLQEIAAWIQAHPDDAAAMNGKISTLETAVGAATTVDAEGTGLMKRVEDLEAVSMPSQESLVTNGVYMIQKTASGLEWIEISSWTGGTY